MRSSQRDHLWAFMRYAPNAHCYYLNIAFNGGIPAYLEHITFDLIIFDWSFVGQKADRKWFINACARINRLKLSNAIKVCMPQDEFTSMDLLCDFINTFNISHVFTVAPESEWPKIYKTVNRGSVSFVRVLTGYLDEAVVTKWLPRTGVDIARPLDIGYRTVATAIWGRFNLLKAIIAEVFEKEATTRGLATDIKVGEQHFKMGDEWLQFLARCRFTLGIEGGSRLLDWDGSIHQAVTEHLKRNPGATFNDLAHTCVPTEREGEINVVAISPRHLEACLTRTVQILVEGEYNGILKPDVHYIPLRADFCNLEAVFERMKDETARQNMAENAYRDIVASGQYTYRSMVEKVLVDTMGLHKPVTRHVSFLDSLLFLVNRGHTAVNIGFLFLWSRLRDLRDFLSSLRQ